MTYVPILLKSVSNIILPYPEEVHPSNYTLLKERVEVKPKEYPKINENRPEFLKIITTLRTDYSNMAVTHPDSSKLCGHSFYQIVTFFPVSNYLRNPLSLYDAVLLAAKSVATQLLTPDSLNEGFTSRSDIHVSGAVEHDGHFYICSNLVVDHTLFRDKKIHLNDGYFLTPFEDLYYTKGTLEGRVVPTLIKVNGGN